ncbi:hypothetical protein E3P92_03881 [Wallemia ichthyophaga]|nr:hypothetical protein E3P91_03934 [Wallemia ichthyophaga]TIB08082.1 hypothetical protein E3P92_03881 [Wallemia ichthyophaga]
MRAALVVAASLLAVSRGESQASISAYNLDQPYRGSVSDGTPAQLGVNPPQSVSYPYTTDYPSILVRPVAQDAENATEFDVMGEWGVNMPYKSAPSLIHNTSPFPPPMCTVAGVTLLQRHGERYPSSWDQARDAAEAIKGLRNGNDELNHAQVHFTGELAFLNNYTYPLGKSKLTSVGRQTMYERGVHFAVLYGALVDGRGEDDGHDQYNQHKMVVRTTTEQRMFSSAILFLHGLFGEEWEEHAQLVQQIEEDGFNSTLNVWNTCNRPDADQGDPRKDHWQAIYLQSAVDRLSEMVVHANFTIADVAGMQDLCAYETIALGYSAFCSLFTKDEWMGYGYGYDLYHYGDAGFGGPVAKASGLGWVEELLARLTNDRANLAYHSSTNSTLDTDPKTFPTDQPVNIDFTHDVTIGEVVTALNLTQFARPLSQDYITEEQTRWKSNAISPFAANLLVQTLLCDGAQYARVVLNDAVQPLDGLVVAALAGATPLKQFETHNALNQRATAISAAASHTSDSTPWPTEDGYENPAYALDQGHRGATPTGVEPAAIQTAPVGSYPYVKQPASGVYKPRARDAASAAEFDVTGHWGVLTPYRSAPAILDSSPLPPPGCSVDGINVVHRHGSRYPTPSANPAKFAEKLSKAVADSNNTVEFTGEIEFMAEWTYKLGSAILTPIGRTEESDSGSSFRTNYGYLLNGFTEHKPVFRTTTQSRMLHSAEEFLSGFFGVDEWETNAHLVQIIEDSGGFNNTLTPYQTCENGGVSSQGSARAQQWYYRYLQPAQARLNAQTTNFHLTLDDVYALQDTCAYETVALGYSQFCHLFTRAEWEGYEYAADLTHYGNDSFGSPLARARGLGWVQELLYRLTGDREALAKPSTINSTLDANPETLPLQPINIDFSHDVVLANILTALNLTHLDTPLGTHHVAEYSKDNLRWVTSHLIPFASNIVVQSLSCYDTPFNRIVVNDAVHPLNGIEGCEENEHGLCAREQFVGGLWKIVDEIDYAEACNGDVADELVSHGVPEHDYGKDKNKEQSAVHE